MTISVKVKLVSYVVVVHLIQQNLKQKEDPLTNVLNFIALMDELICV